MRNNWLILCGNTSNTSTYITGPQWRITSWCCTVPTSLVLNEDELVGIVWYLRNWSSMKNNWLTLCGNTSNTLTYVIGPQCWRTRWCCKSICLGRGSHTPPRRPRPAGWGNHSTPRCPRTESCPGSYTPPWRCRCWAGSASIQRLCKCRYGISMIYCILNECVSLTYVFNGDLFICLSYTA